MRHTHRQSKSFYVKIPIMFRKIKEDGEMGARIIRSRAASLFYRSIEEMDSIKIRYEIRKLERELDDYYLEAGKLIFDRLQKGSNIKEEEPELTSIYSKAFRVLKDIDLLKAELEQKLKPEKKEPE